MIGRNMFAIDGVKLPSNASKQWSGRKGDSIKKLSKLERAIRDIVARHRQVDLRHGENEIIEK